MCSGKGVIVLQAGRAREGGEAVFSFFLASKWSDMGCAQGVGGGDWSTPFVVSVP